jgi:MotA/TolQ/ExbB proton channel family protein
MSSRKLFLSWFLIVNLMALATVIGIKLGAVGWIHTQDPTYISFGTIALCWAATVYCGPLAWNADRTISRGRDALDNLPKLYGRIKNAKFAKDMCPFLGLLGTVIGLIMMLVNFQKAGAEITQESLRAILVNLGTALVTTAVGMICGALLWIQSHMTEVSLETYENETLPEAQ